MESLTPQKEELDKVTSRQAWNDRVRTLSPVVQQLLDSVTMQQNAKRVNECRLLLFLSGFRVRLNIST